MPEFRSLVCHLEWAHTKTPLLEYGTEYGPSSVETSVAVPSAALTSPFTLRFRSVGYIAPGIAIFVYKDGVYQCNRNRTNLQLPTPGVRRKAYEVNFNVGQKEILRAGTLFNAKGWSFAEDDSKVPGVDPETKDHSGLIEVIVLRCHPSSDTQGHESSQAQDRLPDAKRPQTSGPGTLQRQHCVCPPEGLQEKPSQARLESKRKSRHKHKKKPNLSQDAGEDGHQRVTLRGGGSPDNWANDGLVSSAENSHWGPSTTAGGNPDFSYQPDRPETPVQSPNVSNGSYSPEALGWDDNDAGNGAANSENQDESWGNHDQIAPDEQDANKDHAWGANDSQVTPGQDEVYGAPPQQNETPWNNEDNNNGESVKWDSAQDNDNNWTGPDAQSNASNEPENRGRARHMQDTRYWTPGGTTPSIGAGDGGITQSKPSSPPPLRPEPLSETQWNAAGTPQDFQFSELTKEILAGRLSEGRFKARVESDAGSDAGEAIMKEENKGQALWPEDPALLNSDPSTWDQGTTPSDPRSTFLYTHKAANPTYLDSHENPYAVFVFRYRDSSNPSGGRGSKKDHRKARLMRMSKGELVRELLRKKDAPDDGGSESDKESNDDEDDASLLTQETPTAAPAPSTSAHGGDWISQGDWKANPGDMPGSWNDEASSKGIDAQSSPDASGGGNDQQAASSGDAGGDDEINEKHNAEKLGGADAWETRQPTEQAADEGGKSTWQDSASHIEGWMPGNNSDEDEPSPVSPGWGGPEEGVDSGNGNGGNEFGGW